MEISVGLSLLFVFLALGMPIAFALGTSSLIGLVLVQGLDFPLRLLQLMPFRSAASFVLTTVPLFVLMAEFLNKSGMAKPVFAAAFRWMAHIRGGLAMGTILGAAGFAACSGSSAASTASLATVAVPEMRRHGYSSALSAGAVAVGGTLGAIIPPSVLLILYGAETETSIGRLLIAGILPGLLLAALYMANIYWVARRHPEEAPSVPAFSWAERLEATREIWPVVVIATIILVCIYTGITTPTEAAAVGAFSTFAIGIATRKLTLHGIISALKATLLTTSMIFAIIIGATLFSQFMTTTGFSQQVIGTIGGLDVAPWVIMLAVIALYVVLGLFLDAVGCLLLTVPFVPPLVVGLGYDPVWFGVVMALLLEIGLLTPPVGILCYITSGATGLPLGTVFRGAGRLLISAFIAVFLLMIFPEIALWLPATMSH